MVEEVHVQVEEGVRSVTLSRPATRNALTLETAEALRVAVEGAGSDPASRAVLLTGSGGAFCSGLDLKTGDVVAAVTTDPERAVGAFQGLIRAVARSDRPVIAFVDGPAVGFGCDLALACDLRFATERAYFQEKFVHVGLVPDGGGSYWLPRMVGLGRALEMMLLGEALGAPRAQELGVVNRLLPADTGLFEAQALARRLAKGPAGALRAIKRATRASLDRGLEDALRAEATAQLECFRGPEVREGIQAFLEKREARFYDID